MLLSAFLSHFEKQTPEKYRTLGASSAGRCGRALAYAQFPERFTPEPMTPRRRARLMAGREFERVVQGVIQKELPAHAAGETAFLWPVEVDEETMQTALAKVLDGRLKGHILPGMKPNDIARWRETCEREDQRYLAALVGSPFAAAGMLSQSRARLGGIVLDPDANTVYIPALSDGIVDLSLMPEFAREKYALATQEFKTIATAGFRHVLRGVLDYGYRVQCAIQVDAAQLDAHVLMFYRLETSHGIEIIYARKADKLRATWTLTNGSRVVNDGAEPVGEWDEVQLETPFDARLLEQARERFRKVLRASPDQLPEREYGPSFVCDDCDGDGTKKCAYCDERGMSKRAKTEKKCGAEGCENGRAACTKCERGALQETELGFPCSYCPFLKDCYGDLVRVEMPTKPGDAGGRPRFLVKHSDFAASGITYAHPETSR